MDCSVDYAPRVGKMPPLSPVPIKTVGVRNRLWIALTAKRTYEYTDDWHVQLSSGETVVIEKGSRSDGASIPTWVPQLMTVLAINYIDNVGLLYAAVFVISQLMRVVLSPMGLALIPGLLHDELYKNHYLKLADGGRFLEGCTRWQADNLFKREYFFVNDLPIIGLLKYYGLRAGSFIAWSKHRSNVDLSPRKK